MSIRTLLVTGGAGFIGSAVVRQAVKAGFTVLNYDKLTYAASLESLRDVEDHPLYQFVHGDICDAELVRRTIADLQPDAIIHLAAESHVDRSIDGPGEFVHTNIQGTFVMLNEARRYWAELSGEARARFRFVQVSTDEVFGSLHDDGLFTENSPYSPNSPYSASKAAGDHLARAWHATYGVPVIVTNCSNNYGPYQFPEKLIPLAIQRALAGEEIPVYGDGLNVRDWLYVEDHAAGLLLAATRGTPGSTYLFGGRAERTNLQLLHTLCAALDEFRPEGAPHERLKFVTDRPGHDRRYAIDPSSAEHGLDWKAGHDFDSGMRDTVRWYLANRDWAERIHRARYRGERLGTVGMR
ncbi:MAG TPA: dTDP-glucose 4,6-dehydratase [Gemmatimonadaceae bacterium]|nr:dTDP-glucose 4,6-dehydratase [Gemmatimonadaceae bacterium]